MGVEQLCPDCTEHNRFQLRHRRKLTIIDCCGMWAAAIPSATSEHWQSKTLPVCSCWMVCFPFHLHCFYQRQMELYQFTLRIYSQRQHKEAAAEISITVAVCGQQTNSTVHEFIISVVRNHFFCLSFAYIWRKQHKTTTSLWLVRQ